MIKNRTAQLIFQSSYCAIGILGIIASLGVFEYTFYAQFYAQFTNLSNYMCVAIMFIELGQTALKHNDSYVSALPKLKFIGTLAILLTFLVFNILLAGAPDRDPAMNYKIASVIFHLILPIMFIADWILFYERGKVKWFYPFLSMLVPLIYVAFIFVRAWFLNFDPNAPLIYPYFFLNLETQGVAGVAKWVGILVLAFVVGGMLFYAFDHLFGKKSHAKVARF